MKKLFPQISILIEKIYFIKFSTKTQAMTKSNYKNLSRSAVWTTQRKIDIWNKNADLVDDNTKSVFKKVYNNENYDHRIVDIWIIKDHFDNLRKMNKAIKDVLREAPYHMPTTKKIMDSDSCKETAKKDMP